MKAMKKLTLGASPKRSMDEATRASGWAPPGVTTTIPKTTERPWERSKHRKKKVQGQKIGTKSPMNIESRERPTNEPKTKGGAWADYKC